MWRRPAPGVRLYEAQAALSHFFFFARPGRLKKKPCNMRRKLLTVSFLCHETRGLRFTVRLTPLRYSVTRAPRRLSSGFVFPPFPSFRPPPVRLFYFRGHAPLARRAILAVSSRFKFHLRHTPFRSDQVNRNVGIVPSSISGLISPTFGPFPRTIRAIGRIIGGAVQQLGRRSQAGSARERESGPSVTGATRFFFFFSQSAGALVPVCNKALPGVFPSGVRCSTSQSVPL